MRTLAIIIVSVIVGAALGVGTAVTRIKMTPWEPKFDATGATATASIGPLSKALPKVAVGRTDYDFGIIDRDAGGRHAFTIRNVGEASLTLRSGGTSDDCLAAKLDREEVPLGESARATVTWTGFAINGGDRQTATILTNDPTQPRIVFSVTGRVMSTLRALPAWLTYERVTAGEPATAEARLLCYLDEPLKVLGHEWSDSATAEDFEVASEPLSSEDLEQEPQARSGLLVRVTVRPGLPPGPFEQTLVLHTNLAPMPTLKLPIAGTVVSEISVAGQGWDQDRGVLYLGTILSRVGMQHRLLLLVRGPHRKEATFKVAHVAPGALKVTLGQSSEINDGLVVQTPLTIEVPPGSPAVNYLHSAKDKLGEITLDTAHPREPKLRIRVNFAIAE